MSTCLRIFLLILVLLIALPGSATPPPSERAAQALANLQRASENPWRDIWLENRIRWLTGGHLDLGSTDPVEAGQRFLAAHGSVLGLADPAQETRLRSTKRGKTLTRLDYDQIYGGRRVIDGRLVLTVDDSGVLCSLHSSIKPITKTVRRSILLVVPDDVVRTVSEALKIQSLRGPVSRELAVLVENGEPREVWEVRIPSTRPLGDFIVLVDAATGRLLRKRDVLWRLDGTGRVFDPNPVVTLRNTSLKDEADAADAVPQNAYRTVTLRDIDPSGVLRGPYVSVSDTFNQAREPSLLFFYNRSDERFEQVMVYFHIDRSRRYLESLGYTSILDFPLTVVAIASDEDQSYYSSFSKQLTYGTGGVDDAEDADIIIHEYGHAIQDDQIPGFGASDEALAIGEGFGDYWAFSNDSDGTFNREIIADWDAVAYSTADPPYLRRVDEDLRYPNDLVHQEHEDGRIWSRALYDIWNVLGKTITDTLVIESHFALSPDATFFDGALAIYQTDRRLYGGAHLQQIFTAFDARGLAAATLSKSRLIVTAGETVPVSVRDAVLGGPASLRWEQIAGPPAVNRIATSDMLSFVAPDPPDEGLMVDLVFRLYVERNGSIISHNDLSVTVLDRSIPFDAPPLSAAIPDNFVQGLTRTIEITESGPVSEIVVYIEVEHTYRGDLQVELTSPFGVISTLLPASDDPGSGLELLLHADETAENGEELRPFLGQETQGAWTLKVSDIAAADTGSLRHWALGIRTVGSSPEKPTPISIDLRNESPLYREEFESTDLTETGFIAYPGGLDASHPPGRAQLGTPTWGDFGGQYQQSLLLSAAPSEVITVVLDPTHAIPTEEETLLSVRVSSSGAGVTVAVALVEQSFDGSIGYVSPIDSAVFQDSWTTLNTYFSPTSGGVLPVLQIANITGTEEVSVAFDDLVIYPVRVIRDE